MITPGATAQDGPQALFVWLRYFAGMPHAGECGWRSIVEPFSANGVGGWDAYFYDQELAEGRDKDEGLLAACRQKKYDVLFLYWMPDLSYWYLNIDPATLLAVRAELGVPIVSIWYDTWHPKYAEQAMALAPLCDLCVITDSLAHVAEAPRQDKFLGLCYSPNVQQFHNPGLERTIPLSHNGELGSRPDRMAVLDAVERAGLPLSRHGGLGSAPLSNEAYAEVFQRSKITINFSATPTGKRTFKARVMEAALCGAMLLDQDNAETASRFIPYEEYVPFEDAADLIDKARYYLEHEDERAEIARRGMLRARELARPEHFWGRIVEELKRPGLYSVDEARAGLEHYVNVVAPNQRMQKAKASLDRLLGRRVAVWGSGGAYRDNFAEWLQGLGGSIDFVGFVDSNEANRGKTVDGRPVFGPDEIAARGVQALILANHAARVIFNQYSALLPGVRFYD